jgi:hypothetical protein
MIAYPSRGAPSLIKNVVKSTFLGFLIMLTIIPLFITNPVHAKQEMVTLTSRYNVMGGGPNITLSYFLDMPTNGDPKAVLLVIPGGNGMINLKTQDGNPLPLVLHGK